MPIKNGELKDVLCVDSIFVLGKAGGLLCSSKYFIYDAVSKKRLVIDDQSYLYPFILIGRAFEIQANLNVKYFIEAKPDLEQFMQAGWEKELICEGRHNVGIFSGCTSVYSVGIRKLFSKLSLQEWQENFKDLYWLIQQGLKLTKRFDKIVDFSQKSKKGNKNNTSRQSLCHEIAIHMANMLNSQIMLLMASGRYTQAIRPSLDLLRVVNDINNKDERQINSALAYLMLAIIEARENFLASACRNILRAFQYEKGAHFPISAIQYTTGYLETSLQCAEYCIAEGDTDTALIIFQCSLKSPKNEFLKYRKLQMDQGLAFPDSDIERKYDDLQRAYQNFVLKQFLDLGEFNDVFSAAKIIQDQTGEFKLTFKFHNDKVLPENIKKQTEEIKVANNYFTVKLTGEFKLEKFLKIIQEIIDYNQPPIVEALEEVLVSQPQAATAVVESSDATVLPETPVPDLKTLESSETQEPTEITGSSEVATPNQMPVSSSPSQKNLPKETSKKEIRSDENRLNKISHVAVPKVIFWKNLGVSYSNVDSACGVVPLSRGRGEQQLISEGIWYGTISNSVTRVMDEFHLKRFKDILDKGNFVGRYGQGVKWLKQPITVSGFEYVVELKTCGMGERGTQRLYGRVADTADLDDQKERVRHPKLIMFDAFSEDGHKKGIQLCNKLNSHVI